MMGEKDRARREVKTAGLPTIPGSDGAIEGEEQLATEAGEDWLPFDFEGRGLAAAVAACALCASRKSCFRAYETARSEAQQAFGTPDVYAERFLEHPRHIEFQVLGDQHGK